MSEVSKKTTTKTAVKKSTAKVEEPKYTKMGLFVLSEFNTTDKDIINIVLKDNEKYTLKEVKQAIKKFKEGI